MIRNYKITKGTATKLIVIFSTIVYSLFLGAFPFGFGKDYLNYVEIFREIALEGVSFDSRYEPVFVIVTLITKTILRFDYLVFVIFISISASIKIYACRRINGNIFVLVIVYTLMYAPLYDNNQIRAGVGVAIIYLAIAILDTNKYQALTLLFLSVLTHYSMILLVAPIAIWLIFLSTKLSLIQKSLLVIAVSLSIYFSHEFIVYKLFPSAVLLADEQETGSKRIFGANFVFTAICISITAIYGTINKKLYLTILILGVLEYFFLIYQKLPYQYRVLETASSIIPIVYASIYSNNIAARKAIIGAIALMAIYSPFYWISLVSSA